MQHSLRPVFWQLPAGHESPLRLLCVPVSILGSLCTSVLLTCHLRYGDLAIVSRTSIVCSRIRILMDGECPDG